MILVESLSVAMGNCQGQQILLGGDDALFIFTKIMLIRLEQLLVSS